MNARAGRVESIPSLETLEARLLLSIASPAISLAAVTSSTVSLNWNAIPGATACRVYIAPEPPATPGAALPGEVLLATLSGSATSYQITNLAPAIDTYMRVEVDNGGTGGTDVYAKTVGGPLATLDSNHVREVHMVAPNVLELIYADNINHGAGNDGPTLQSGPWTITRADGSTISVSHTYRFSRPVGTPASYVNGAISVDNDNVDTDHTIYLALGANVGSRDVLTIAGPLGINIHFLFSDQYTETPVIQVNQVGYNPRATERWAYIGQWMGDGGGLPLDNFPAAALVTRDSADPLVPRVTQLSSLAITPRSVNDPESGSPVDQIDLSTLPTAEGVRYRIRVPGVGVSWPTAVSEEAAFKAYYTVARGLYYNRWAGDLSSLQYTEWTRPQDHVTLPDGTSTVYTGELADWNQTFPSDQPLTGARQVIGGHHDAGDWDLRASHTQVPQLLMRAFEINSANLTDSQLTNPQSGNGIPDLLDEALWNIQSWEALQEADGGVRGGVQWQGDGCRGYYFASDDPHPWFTFARDPQVTARAAGLFAQAAYLVKPYNSARAAQLQGEAISAYNWAKDPSHLDFIGAPAAHSYLMYASGELYRLTGSATYKADFESNWNALNKWGGGAFDSGVTTDLGYMGDYTGLHRTMPDFLQGYLHGSNPSPTIVSICRSHFQSQSTTSVAQTLNDHAYRNSRPGGVGEDWGNGTVPNRFMDQTFNRTSMANISGSGLTAQQQSDYFNSLSLDADYILGCNPAGLVYISGLGSRHTTDNLHVDMITWEAQGKGQLPGIPEYGPVGAFSTQWYYLGSISAFYPATTNGTNLPAAYRFGDTKVFVNCSEFDVSSVSAPLTELFATLLGPGWSTPPASYLPGGANATNPLPSFGPLANRAPVVEAGFPQTVSLPNHATLNAQVADDHFPGTTITQTWSVVSSDGPVSLGNVHALNSTVNFTMGGNYVLRLTVSDGLTSSSDDVTIAVKGLPFHWTCENAADSNTLALYHFNETSGTAAVNAQGNASRNLTLGSASMITSGIDFIGRSSYFLNASFGTAVSSAAAIPTDYSKGLTISFWYKTADQTSANFTPVSINNSGYKNVNGFGYHPGWSGPYHPYMANVGGSCGTLDDLNTRLLDGNWHNVAITHRPSDNTARLFVDNVLMATWSDSGGINLASTAQLVVGGGLGGVNAYIDELLIEQSEVTSFDRALNANHAPVAAADHYSTYANSPLVVAAPGLLGNDTDADGDSMSAVTATDPAHGKLILNGDGSFSYTPDPGFTGTDSFTYLSSDMRASSSGVVTIAVYSRVVSRQIFYNDSIFDGYTAAANASDDSAVATDKQALLPGTKASFANYTSYSCGINGIMVDIAGLTNPGSMSVADLAFRVGNSNAPGIWGVAPAPASVTLRPGAGVGGSDRVTIIWADNAIQDQWLQVTVKADANTNLASDDVFYFGNAIGESGNLSGNTCVNAADELAARNDPHTTFLNPAAITDPCDFNRDGRVTAADQIIARDHETNLHTDLILLGQALAGDFNRDGKVDDGDYTVWSDFHKKTPPPQYALGSDPSGGYNDADYTAWADNYRG